MDGIDKKAVWPGWETVRLLGRGSFGAVYEIERDMLGEKEKAALKVISIPQSENDISEMAGDGYDEESITSTFREQLKSIVAEYSLMRRMNGSSNVVNCDDVRYVQHDDGIGWDIYIKMELLTPLTKALGQNVSEAQVIRIAMDLSRALVQCRQFNIVHRDIKPQNIFVSPLGDYKLGDFGIAKTMERTSGGTKIGTYKYMAPEVYNNRPYGATADIYSLGLMLYWLLNERRMPFLPLPPEKLSTALEEQARLRRFAGEPIPAPAHGSEELRRIVLKACAFDPKDRYQSAEEMLYDLDALDRTAPAPRPRAAAAAPAPRQESAAPQPVKGPEEEEGTVGVFREEKKAAAIPQTVKGPTAPPAGEPDEEATVADRAAYIPKAAPAALQKQRKAAPAAPAKKKKFPVWIPIVAVLAVAAVLALVLWLPQLLDTTSSSSGRSGGSRREREARTETAAAEQPASDAGPASSWPANESVVLADYDHAAWVAHGQYLLADGTLNYWGGKDSSLYEASALRAISFEELRAIDEELYDTLLGKNVKYLYTIDLIFGTNDAGWTTTFVIDGNLFKANGSYAFKITQCAAEMDGDNVVYAEEQWISDPWTANAESLTPATVFYPPWQEETDEYGLSWTDNPVVTGGAGLYTLVIAQYDTVSAAGNPGYGVGLVLKEAKDGIPYEWVPAWNAADHTYGLIGAFTEWSADVPMEPVGDNTWSGTVKMKAGDEFKIRADGDWYYSWGDETGANFVCTADGTYTVTIDFSYDTPVVDIVKK